MMSSFLGEFRDFAIKGNLIELAVAFILGIAFAAVVTSLVDDIIMPIIGAIVSDEAFTSLTFSFLGVEVFYGNFLAVLVNFLIIAFILFLIVKVVNQLRKEEEEATTKGCPYCASEIPIAAVRCPNCTSALTTESVATEPAI